MKKKTLVLVLVWEEEEGEETAVFQLEGDEEIEVEEVES